MGLTLQWSRRCADVRLVAERARGAVRGIVTDAAGEAVAGAVVRVRGRTKDVVTSSRGEYWRLLVPGNYSLQDSLIQF